MGSTRAARSWSRSSVGVSMRILVPVSLSTSAPTRVIVIPRQLEGFFYERLKNEFAARSGVSGTYLKRLMIILWAITYALSNVFIKQWLKLRERAHGAH